QLGDANVNINLFQIESDNDPRPGVNIFSVELRGKKGHALDGIDGPFIESEANSFFDLRLFDLTVALKQGGHNHFALDLLVAGLSSVFGQGDAQEARRLQTGLLRFRRRFDFRVMFIRWLWRRGELRVCFWNDDGFDHVARINGFAGFAFTRGGAATLQSFKNQKANRLAL